MLDARVLMKKALQTDDAGLIARSHEAISPTQSAHFFRDIDRRKTGEPVAYIVGEQEFWRHRFLVSADVLIPRPDSECLIEAAIDRRSCDSAFTILDLGVGSGCLLCSLLAEFPNAVGVGVDRSLGAVKMAIKNAARIGVARRAHFLVGDWGDALRGDFDMVIANPPYIKEGEKACLADDVVSFEPHGALFSGAEGLDDLQRIFAQLPSMLAVDGVLIVETGAEQGAAIDAMAQNTAPDARLHPLFDLAGRRRGAVLDFGLGEKRD